MATTEGILRLQDAIYETGTAKPAGFYHHTISVVLTCRQTGDKQGHTFAQFCIPGFPAELTWQEVEDWLAEQSHIYNAVCYVRTVTLRSEKWPAYKLDPRCRPERWDDVSSDITVLQRGKVFYLEWMLSFVKDRVGVIDISYSRTCRQHPVALTFEPYMRDISSMYHPECDSSSWPDPTAIMPWDPELARRNLQALQDRQAADEPGFYATRLDIQMADEFNFYAIRHTPVSEHRLNQVIRNVRAVTHSLERELIGFLKVEDTPSRLCKSYMKVEPVAFSPSWHFATVIVDDFNMCAAAITTGVPVNGNLTFDLVNWDATFDCDVLSFLSKRHDDDDEMPGLET
jgi:hypothetical protein